MEPIKKKTFDEWVEGRACKSCAIIKPDTFCFILEWSQAEDAQKSGVAQLYLVHRLHENNSDGKPQDFGVKFKNGTGRRLAANPNDQELIISSYGGDIIYHVSQGEKSEKQLDGKDIPTICQVKYIGNHFYVAGFDRSVLRREGVNQWTHLSHDIMEDSFDVGFEDIDGFDENDIYAVGGEGDVWYYNGKKWSPVDIPTNMSIYSVCCASDGNVYIGGNCHVVVRGIMDQWEVIHKDESYRSFEQIVNFQGRLLTVDEWGGTIFEITPNGVIEMDTGDFEFVAATCLCLAVGHGMLLAAGKESAVVYDGKSWHELISPAMGVSDDDLLEQLASDVGQTLDDVKDALEDMPKKP